METQKDFEKIEMPILSQLLVLYESVHTLVFSFPKYERYSLGEKMQETILSAMELAVIANGSNKYEKEKILLRANAKIELLKVLVRIALNCKMLETRHYIETQRRIQEIGKMIQGWIRYSRNIA